MWLRGVRAEVTGLGVAAAILAMAAVFDVVEGADLLALAVLLMLGGAGLFAARFQVMTRTESDTARSSADPAQSIDPGVAYDTLLAEPAVREGSLSEAVRALLEGTASAIPLDRIALYLATPDREQVRMAGAFEPGAAAHTSERMVARAELMPFETLLEAQSTRLVVDCEMKPPIGDRSARSVDDGACRHLAVPVVIDGRTDGFLWLARTDLGQPWSQSETLLAAAVSGLVADVIRRIERADTERAALKSRQTLARQNAVMNELLRPGPVRDGELGEAMRELSRTLSIEAGIDRVAITVLGTKRDDVRYAEAYVAAEGSHQDVFTTAAVRPGSMVHAARPEFMIVADDVRTSRALAPFYEGLLKVLDIRSFMQMPIEVGGRVVGIVNASICGRTVAWSIEQRLFLIAIAQLAALVIERDARRRAEARVAAQAETLTRQLEALTNLMRDDVVVRGGLDEALDRLIRMLGLEIGAERVGLTLYEHDTHNIAYRRRYDAPTDRHTEWTDSEGDLAPEAIEMTIDAAAASAKANGLLRTPVIVGGRVAGILTAQSPRPDAPWRPDQKLMALALAQLAALTLERVQLSRMDRELRRASSAADAANKAKSRFLASMSHEIRTPMNGVMGMTDHLLRTALDDWQRRMATTIHECAGTLLSLINDILDLSRIEAGRIEIEPRRTASRDLCESVVDLFAPDVARKGLDLTLVIATGVPDAIMVDDHRLRQVLINLVGNAVKFTDAGEVVVTVSASEDHTRIRIAVKDTGIGVAPERLSALFEPFTQADSSISRRFGGTGLGLAISKRLVGLMGGTIGMTSEPGRGSEVTIDLPLVAAEASPAQIQLAERRVVLISPPGASRDRARTELEHAGATVIVEDTGVAADTSRRAVEADAIVVNLNRQGATRDALRALAKSGEHGIPVVALLPPGIPGNQGSIGGVTTIVAPYRRQDLIAAVARGPAAEHSSRAITAPARPRFGKRVLLVEDNAVNELVLSEHLLAFGCGVQVVRDGASAVAAAEKGRFDLILMDRQLPGMDGLSATRAIRAIEARRRRKRTPIVLVTASAFPEDVAAARRAGCDDHLAKPFSEEALTATLERVLGAGAKSPVLVDQTPTRPASAKRKPASRSAKARPAKAAPQLAPQQPAGIDETALRRLQTTNARLFERLLRTYIDYTPAVITALRAAADTNDAAGLRLAAHSLKSSSANVCATALAELARAAEASAANGSIDDANCGVARIELEFAAVVARLTSELDRVSRPAA
ncbi:MAG: response regulator [Hyphomicrobiales bacterium]|nr:response regulator [Hyphomicrobiales bacterium]